MGDRAGQGRLTYDDGHKLKGTFEQGGFMQESIDEFIEEKKSKPMKKKMMSIDVLPES